MSDFFHFKQFSVNQSGCGMKINTDGVLLGALVQSADPFSILDIGTGTGVIAMMLAQRFPGARIDAIEIDAQAANTALNNFQSSQFSDRLTLCHQSFQNFSKENPDKKYDLIVSNPPFFTNSLRNPDDQKQLARHTDSSLFSELITFSRQHLTLNGASYFILPSDTAEKVIDESLKHNFKPQHIINVSSSAFKAPHRKIIRLEFNDRPETQESFIIYQSHKVYSAQYQSALKDFLTIF